LPSLRGRPRARRRRCWKHRRRHLLLAGNVPIPTNRGCILLAQPDRGQLPTRWRRDPPSILPAARRDRDRHESCPEARRPRWAIRIVIAILGGVWRPTQSVQINPTGSAEVDPVLAGAHNTTIMQPARSGRCSRRPGRSLTLSSSRRRTRDTRSHSFKVLFVGQHRIGAAKYGGVRVRNGRLRSLAYGGSLCSLKRRRPLRKCDRLAAADAVFVRARSQAIPRSGPEENSA
jgi:hypothetical protein